MSKNNNPHSIELFDTLRRAPTLLNSAARDRIANFIINQLTPEGGFANRAGVCDQYYTMFGLGCAATLNIPDWTKPYTPTKHIAVNIAKRLSSFIS